MVWLPGTCGSWLASDADNSTHLPDRGAAIAGKPGSHKGGSGVAPRYLWELARQRCRQLGIPPGPRCSHRGQARLSHKGDLWERACQRCRKLDMPAGAQCSHRGQARLSHKGDRWELACQRCRQLDMPAGAQWSHRGQARLPQRVEWGGSPVPVGAGSPAMQTTRHACRSAVQPSRASLTLTKGGMVWFPGTCGSWLASDADNSTCLPDRGAAIAGKPDSHKGWNGVVPRYLWELARQRCRQLGIPVGPR